MTNPVPKEWHREVISDAAESVLHALRDAAVLEHVYLAGGTGLALQIGHRRSEDLDFFAQELFDENILLQRIERAGKLSMVEKAPHTVHATLKDTKITFLGYKYPLLFPLTTFLEVAVADARDIACMKISAIASRGTMRDFVDLYVVTREYGLAELLRLFDQKYAKTGYNKVHTLKSLTFFADAEKDAMPHMLVPLDWDEVKRFFWHEVPRLVQ